jgi:hypothetical protein
MHVLNSGASLTPQLDARQYYNAALRLPCRKMNTWIQATDPCLNSRRRPTSFPNLQSSQPGDNNGAGLDTLPKQRFRRGYRILERDMRADSDRLVVYGFIMWDLLEALTACIFSRCSVIHDEKERLVGRLLGEIIPRVTISRVLA